MGPVGQFYSRAAMAATVAVVAGASGGVAVEAASDPDHKLGRPLLLPVAASGVGAVLGLGFAPQLERTFGPVMRGHALAGPVLGAFLLGAGALAAEVSHIIAHTATH